MREIGDSSINAKGRDEGTLSKDSTSGSGRSYSSSYTSASGRERIGDFITVEPWELRDADTQRRIQMKAPSKKHSFISRFTAILLSILLFIWNMLKKVVHGMLKKHIKSILVLWRTLNWSILYLWILNPLIDFLFKETVLRWIDMICNASITVLIKACFIVVAAVFAWAIPMTPKNDPLRIGLGCTLTIIPTIILFICSKIGGLGILGRGGLIVSILIEGVVTDAKGGRVPSKKDVTDIEGTPEGKIRIFKYKQ